jgi:hypothetical protein
MGELNVTGEKGEVSDQTNTTQDALAVHLSAHHKSRLVLIWSNVLLSYS